jgi:hypothetical protein
MEDEKNRIGTQQSDYATFACWLRAGAVGAECDITAQLVRGPMMHAAKDSKDLR